MSNPVKIAFEQKIVTLPIAKLLPTRTVPEYAKQTIKYRRIVASVAEIGAVEPLSVGRQKDGSFLLLDGHIRLEAYRAAGADEVPCVIAEDDEAFTYNKRVSRLATVQEHYMIVRALDRGVSEDKLARALDIDVKALRQRRNLLSGISDDVVELLKDKPVSKVAFQKLRKMKPIRQLEAAELMVSANNYTESYARALLATSRPPDLHKPDELTKATGLSAEQMAHLEREMASISEDYKELEASYGDDMLVLVVASGFLERLLSKSEIEGFLADRYPEFLEPLRAIALAASLEPTTA
jgi:ParB-like chromosome segregation protein Spo0J